MITRHTDQDNASLSRSGRLSACWQTEPLLLMEGALSERLKHEFHITVDGPADMAGLVRDPAARTALGILWRQYLTVAETYGLPLLATTPTRRCDRERAMKAGLADGDGKSSILAENMDMLREIRSEANSRGVAMFAGGLMGCRGDAYTGEGCLSAEEALQLHRWQAGLLAEAGADFLYAALMPTLSESLGMAQAMAETGLPFFLSFTIRADGCLVDGTSLHDAIAAIDDSLSSRPLCYMTNCVHPDVVEKALSRPMNRTETVKKRFLGIQANAANLSFQELERSTVTRQSSPQELAGAMLRLRRLFGLRLFGGCCGTTEKHMAAIACALQGGTGINA